MLKYAKNELARIEHDEEGLQDRIDKNILDLMEVFVNQGHSNVSASYVLSIFNRLAHYRPLTPLTGEDNEWNEVGHGCWQNKRYSAVFKGEDGRAYNIEGKIFSDDGGETWFTNINSRIYIDFPYAVPDKPEKVYLREQQGE